MAEPAGAPTPNPRPLSHLKAKNRAPASVSILSQWIRHAENALGVPAAGGRMSWLVASTVVIAALHLSTTALSAGPDHSARATPAARRPVTRPSEA